MVTESVRLGSHARKPRYPKAARLCAVCAQSAVVGMAASAQHALAVRKERNHVFVRSVDRAIFAFVALAKAIGSASRETTRVPCCAVHRLVARRNRQRASVAATAQAKRCALLRCDVAHAVGVVVATARNARDANPHAVAPRARLFGLRCKLRRALRGSRASDEYRGK